jgi:hypothetical protein
MGSEFGLITKDLFVCEQSQISSGELLVLVVIFSELNFWELKLGLEVAKPITEELSNGLVSNSTPSLPKAPSDLPSRGLEVLVLDSEIV